MTPTEHPAKIPPPRTGLFAMLRVFIHVSGTSAPKISQGSSAPTRRYALVPATVLAALAFTTTPALAVLETPQLEVTGRTAEAMRLRGVLNPNGESEGGSYEFLYKESKTGACEGGNKRPEPPGMWIGFQGQEADETLSALKPDTSYAVCLRAENGKVEKATSVPVTVTTAIPLETPSGGEAKPIAATEATLNGVLNPGAERKTEPGSYEFVYRQSPSECQGPGEKVTSAIAASGAKNEPDEAVVRELLPHTQYTFCLRASNEATPTPETALGPPVTFTTLAAPPTIEEQFTTAVASTSATLNAQVNPQGAATTYIFEYAPAGGAFASIPEPEGKGSLLEGATGVSLSVHVQHGLLPGASYEFRLVAKNSVGTATGEPESFATQHSGGEFALPDGRQYEMVTPPQKQGALFKPITGVTGFVAAEANNAVRASSWGSAIADVASAPSEAEPQGNSNTFVSVLSTRGPSAWSSQVIAPPHPEAGPTVPPGGEYIFFSDDLSRAIVQPLGNFAPLSPDATESTAYLHTDYLNGNVGEHCEASYKSVASCFQPLVTAADDTASPFQPFGGADSSGECFRPACGPLFVAGTPDLSHVVVSSPVQITSTPTPIATEVEPEPKPNLYEFSGGRLQLLSIMPGGEVGAGTFALAGSLVGGRSESVAARHAISDDGGRVVLEALKGNETVGLYLRDVPKAETVRLDVPQGEGTEASVEPRYMTANSDASRVFFLDSGHLTTQSSASGADLYEYDPNAPLGNRLTDLTVDPNMGESANVKMVLGSSVDGSDVYFAAAGKLAPGAVNDGECNPLALVGQGCNVYVRHEGVTSFIAGLSPEDERDWKAEGSLTEQPVRVSPHGRWLAFMSNRDLTGYDTRDAVSGRPDYEVYLYDATSNRLLCASCDPTGARPVGSQSVAALVPGWTGVGPGLAFYQSRYLSDSGRLFFDSHDALVPRDVNGNWDVYQYEPEGVPAGEHACTSVVQSRSDVFKPAHGFEVEARKGEEPAGCVALISSGTSSEASTFLDASETGGDVFFLSTAKLAPQDFDTAPDVYDAHECTAASPCISPPMAQPPPCDTEASCKVAPTPQPDIFGAPASGTFSGPGNITPPPPAVKKVTKKTVKCKKNFVKNKKGKCVKKPKKKSKIKKAKRASHDRRGK